MTRANIEAIIKDVGPEPGRMTEAAREFCQVRIKEQEGTPYRPGDLQAELASFLDGYEAGQAGLKFRG